MFDDRDSLVDYAYLLFHVIAEATLTTSGTLEPEHCGLCVMISFHIGRLMVSFSDRKPLFFCFNPIQMF